MGKVLCDYGNKRPAQYFVRWGILLNSISFGICAVGALVQPDSFTSPVWVLIQNYLGLSMLFSVLAASSIFGFWFAYYPNRFTLALHLSLATFVLVFIAGSIFKQYVLGAVSIVPVVFFTLPILSNAVLVGGVYKYHEHVFARSLHGNAVLFRDTR